MKNRRHYIKRALLVTALTLPGSCATMPERIEPEEVSPTDFSNLSCDEIREEIIQANNQLCDMYDEQRATARKDELVAWSGVFFFPVLVYLAKGEDRGDEIGLLKGQTEALYNVAIDKNCPFKEAIITVREERARIKEAQKKQEGLEGEFMILPDLE